MVEERNLLWRDLDLTLPSVDRVKDDLNSEEPSAEMEARRKDQDDQRRMECDRRTGRIIMGGRGRWSAVKRVTMAPIDGALDGVIEVLLATSSHLTRLDIEADALTYDDLNPSDILGTAFIGSCPAFSSLVHIKLGLCTVRNAQTVLRVAALAPNLTSFDVGMALRTRLHVSDDEPPLLPVGDVRTEIRRMRFFFGDTVDEETFGDFEPDWEAIEALEALLKGSPNLRQLSLVYYGWEDDVIADLAVACSRHAGLEELYYWPLTNSILQDALIGIPSTEIAFPALRKIITKGGRSQTDWVYFRLSPFGCTQLILSSIFYPCSPTSSISINTGPRTHHLAPTVPSRGSPCQ
jgi:hypothetical protein